MRKNDPLSIFQDVFADAKSCGERVHRNAVCVSTIDAYGFPNSRFVDLKDVDASGLVFCTALDSAKAIDIHRNPKVGMTVWWEHVATQIRVKGECIKLSEFEANAHWANRSHMAKVVSASFSQSQPVTDEIELKERFSKAVSEYDDTAVSRPLMWGGFRLVPHYFEFLEFKESRLHVRLVFTRKGEQWERGLLQP